MKTNNYHLDLMIPNQAGKDVIYNESLLMIDYFLNSSVLGFIDQKPEKLNYREKYVIVSGSDSNKICYSSIESRGIELLMPFQGMVLYFIKENSFFIYNNNVWQPINRQVDQLPSFEATLSGKFTGIENKYRPDGKDILLYLYLNNDCEIDLNGIQQPLTTLIIKQSYNNSYRLKWPNHILWPNKQPHVMSKQSNAMDIIRLYRIPESEHFLAEIVNQNYQF